MSCNLWVYPRLKIKDDEIVKLQGIVYGMDSSEVILGTYGLNISPVARLVIHSNDRLISFEILPAIAVRTSACSCLKHAFVNVGRQA